MKGDSLGVLAVCRKAGKLKAGFDPAADSLGRDAALVLFSADASPKTKERMSHKAERAGVACLTLPHTADEIDFAIGKRAVVLAITDAGLAELVKARAGADMKEDDDT